MTLSNLTLALVGLLVLGLWTYNTILRVDAMVENLEVNEYWDFVVLSSVGLYVAAIFFLVGVFNFLDMDYVVTKIVVISLSLSLIILNCWGILVWVFLDTFCYLQITGIFTSSLLVLLVVYFIWRRNE